MKMRSFLCILSIGLFSACGTINYVGIETYNPAEVTFPENVAKILVVNNAVPQPSDSGYELNLFGVAQDTCSVKADSALYDACRTLGESMVGASYFNDVLLYNHAMRNDTFFERDTKLTPRQVSDLCEETGADAVVSVDRLLFDMKKNVVAFMEGYVVGSIDVQIAGVIRSYVPGRDAPLATVHVRDSVFWAENADNAILLNLLLPKADDALRTAGKYIASKTYVNFVPHWNKESRWYFTGFGSTWKEASAYAGGEKWNLAEERWRHLYQSSGNWKSQAKAASNLALCHEMKGELKEAYDWAHKSYDLFKKQAGDNAKNTKLLELYVTALGDRIRSDKKLNVQFGKD